MEEKREKNYRLINMEDVQAREVSWLWYPYIPYGKLTIVQGDPGEGKTTFILHLAALRTEGERTRGSHLPRAFSCPRQFFLYGTGDRVL